MALPPEQINIKRRREEEPVETLYIQSELHQTKRRFTDFVFQRVEVGGKGKGSDNGNGSGSRPSDDSAIPSPSPAAVNTARRVLRTPRSVSSLNLSKGSAGRNAAPGPGLGPNPAATGGSGAPMVRATSPGAEFREEKRIAAMRKEKEEKLKRALYSSPAPAPAPAPVPGPGPGPGPGSESANGPSAPSGRGSPASASSGGKASLRRFQITRSGTPVNLHKSVDRGIQKRRGTGPGDGVAVLVEKLKRKPHSRQASMVVDRLAFSSTIRDNDDDEEEEEPPRPRKRPVVNQAEKKWREERKNAISAAKQNISHVLDKGAQAQRQNNWEDESERLAQEFEQIALELDGDDNMEDMTPPAQAPARAARQLPKPSLKYQPRTPNKPRLAKTDKDTDLSAQAPAQPAPADEGNGDDSDGDYVYDVYIRRPLPETGVSNPLIDMETNREEWLRQNGIDTSTRQDIGVIVITQEDEGYWENFAEDDDDEDKWDSEDADSNAENNPANEYPDEELSWDDEDEDEDDPTSVYGKYRHHAASDDEYDFDDSASEMGRAGFVRDYSDDEE